MGSLNNFDFDLSPNRMSRKAIKEIRVKFLQSFTTLSLRNEVFFYSDGRSIVANFFSVSMIYIFCRKKDSLFFQLRFSQNSIQPQLSFTHIHNP